MEKQVYNYFNLRWKPLLLPLIGLSAVLVVVTLGLEYFYDTIELKDLNSHLFFWVFWVYIFFLDYMRKVIITNEGITVKGALRKKRYFTWSEVNSVGFFHLSGFGKLKANEKGKKWNTVMYISKVKPTEVTHTFLANQEQTLQLPFNQELYNLVEQKAQPTPETENTHIS